jgi:hypothetical protein
MTRTALVMVSVSIILSCALAAPARAQVPVVNQSSCSLSWDAPQTNVDGTNLIDLAGYRVYAAATAALLATVTVPFATVPAPELDPPAGKSGTWVCKTLPVGPVVVAITAFDTAVPPNESARTPPFPFVLRDDVSPSAASNVRTP